MHAIEQRMLAARHALRAQRGGQHIEAYDLLKVVPAVGTFLHLVGEHRCFDLVHCTVELQRGGLLARGPAGEEHRASGEEGTSGRGRCHSYLPDEARPKL